MTLEEYEQQKKLIVEQFGQPEWDMREPVNDSASRLKALHIAYLKSKEDVKKDAKLRQNVKELIELLPTITTPVNDEIIRPEWLLAFSTELQRSIVKQWAKNIRASNDSIGQAVGTTATVVRNTKSLEAFKMLERHLTIATKEQASLSAMLALTGLLQSKFDNIRMKAAELILMDQGYLKAVKSEDTAPKEITVDPDRLATLKAMAENRYKNK